MLARPNRTSASNQSPLPTMTSAAVDTTPSPVKAASSAFLTGARSPMAPSTGDIAAMIASAMAVP
jgi:hypothetical protein